MELGCRQDKRRTGAHPKKWKGLTAIEDTLTSLCDTVIIEASENQLICNSTLNVKI